MREVIATRRLWNSRMKTNATPAANVPKKRVADLRKLIDESRRAVARSVNSALVWLY